MYVDIQGRNAVHETDNAKSFITRGDIRYALYGTRDSFLVERRTCDRKVASSNPGRGGGRIFFSRVNFAC